MTCPHKKKQGPIFTRFKRVCVCVCVSEIQAADLKVPREPGLQPPLFCMYTCHHKQQEVAFLDRLQGSSSDEKSYVLQKHQRAALNIFQSWQYNWISKDHPFSPPETQSCFLCSSQ